MRKRGDNHSPGDQRPSTRAGEAPTDGYGYSAAGCVDCELRSALSTDHGRTFATSTNTSLVMPLPKTAGDNDTLRPSGWWSRGGVTVAAPPPESAQKQQLQQQQQKQQQHQQQQQQQQQQQGKQQQQHARLHDIHLFMGKYVDVNLTDTARYSSRDYALTVWHLRLEWNGSRYSPAAVPKQIARDDDNGECDGFSSSDN
jgi:hypothetical protein